jgi:hypothetical protein
MIQERRAGTVSANVSMAEYAEYAGRFLFFIVNLFNSSTSALSAVQRNVPPFSGKILIFGNRIFKGKIPSTSWISSIYLIIILTYTAEPFNFLNNYFCFIIGDIHSLN